MAQLNLPPALVSAAWEKHKAAVAKLAKPPVTKLGDELKTLARLHAAVDFGAFGADKLDSVEKTRQGSADFEDAVKGKLKPLLGQLDTVVTSASKFETDAKKDKQFPKEPLVAATAITKAAKELRAGIDEFVASARKALAARAQALAASKPKAAGPPAAAGGAESKAVKTVRSRALDVIRRVKKPPPGAKPMRFVVVQGKTTVATYLGPSVGPAQEKLLKGLIPTEAPYKVFKDPQSDIVWEKNALTIVSDRLQGGLVKKMQLWLKKILKLNLKLRVRKTNGEVEESEGEDIPDDLLEEDPAEVAARIADGKDYQARLARLQPEIRKAMAGPAAAELQALISELTRHGNGGDYAAAAADLDEIEALLEGGGEEAAQGTGEPAQGASGPTSAVPKTAAAPAAAAGNAMELWKTRRVAAVTALRAVAAKIAAAKHPSSTKAILEIQAVTKNLTAEPATLQQITELQTWLGSDDVVNDVCELAEDIRTPLLGALAQLRAGHPA